MLNKVLYYIIDNFETNHSEKFLWIKSFTLSFIGNSFWEIAYPDSIHLIIKVFSVAVTAVILRIVLILLDKYLPLKNKDNDKKKN